MLLSNDGARHTAIMYKLEFFIYSMVFRMFDLSRLNSFGFVFSRHFHNRHVKKLPAKQQIDCGVCDIRLLHQMCIVFDSILTASCICVTFFECS